MSKSGVYTKNQADPGWWRASEGSLASTVGERVQSRRPETDREIQERTASILKLDAKLDTPSALERYLRDSQQLGCWQMNCRPIEEAHYGSF